MYQSLEKEKILEEIVEYSLKEGDGKTLLYTGRNFFIDEHGDNIYSKIGKALNEVFLESGKVRFKEFYKHQLKQAAYNFEFKEKLNRWESFDKSIHEIIEIPFHVYLSFDENYFLRKIIKGKPYVIEDWTFSDKNTFKSFLHSSPNENKILTFPVLDGRAFGNRIKTSPFITKDHLFYLLSFLHENKGYLETYFEEYSKVSTIIILGVRQENKPDLFLDMLLNFFSSGEYSRVLRFGESLFDYLDEIVSQSDIDKELFFRVKIGGTNIFF